MAQHSKAQHGTAQHSTAQHGMAQHGMARHGTARHGMARHGTAWHGTAHGVVLTLSRCLDGLGHCNAPAIMDKRDMWAHELYRAHGVYVGHMGRVGHMGAPRTPGIPHVLHRVHPARRCLLLGRLRGGIVRGCGFSITQWNNN